MTLKSLNITTFETIAALSTPPGRSAIALIRLSGSNSTNIIGKLAKKTTLKLKPRFATLIKFPALDEVIVTYFRAPYSYTGEDMAEIACHGSPVIVRNILGKIFEYGGREAGPGEFSMRAVLNGKMTLDEAEKINAKINANSFSELNILESSPHMEKLLLELLDKAYDALSDLESDIEFQEGIEVGSFGNLLSRLKYLLAQSNLSEKNSNLPVVLLYGPPNCGKSTLFNRILGYNRALVSSIPGTTRDYIESEFSINNHIFRLVDSAGIRKSEDHLEKAGVSHSESLFESAHVVIDFSNDEYDDERIIFVDGKSDLKQYPHRNRLKISGYTGEGVEQLLILIEEKLSMQWEQNEWNIWIPHRTAEIFRELETILTNAEREQLPELKAEYLTLFCENLRTSIDEPPEDLYERIFSKFCIGK